jgi:hypothetical protein
VVMQSDGSPLQPNSLTHAFTTLGDYGGCDCMISGTATRLRCSKAAPERLGHSKVGITLDLYSHVLWAYRAKQQRALTT